MLILSITGPGQLVARVPMSSKYFLANQNYTTAGTSWNSRLVKILHSQIVFCGFLVLQLQPVKGAGTVHLGTGQDAGQHAQLKDCNKIRQSTGKPVQVTMNKGASQLSNLLPTQKKHVSRHTAFLPLTRCGWRSNWLKESVVNTFSCTCCTAFLS